MGRKRLDRRTIAGRIIAGCKVPGLRRSASQHRPQRHAWHREFSAWKIRLIETTNFSNNVRVARTASRLLEWRGRPATFLRLCRKQFWDYNSRVEWLLVRSRIVELHA